MLVTFKSRAAADVIMFGEVAQQILQLLGKDPAEPRGIFTEEQLPEAIARLRAAMAEERARSALRDEGEEDEGDGSERRGMGAPVSLAQRAWPLLEMMEYSLREHCPVTWGV